MKQLCHTSWPAPPWPPRWGRGWPGASRSTHWGSPRPACWSCAAFVWRPGTGTAGSWLPRTCSALVVPAHQKNIYFNKKWLTLIKHKKCSEHNEVPVTLKISLKSKIKVLCCFKTEQENLRYFFFNSKFIIIVKSECFIARREKTIKLRNCR